MNKYKYTKDMLVVLKSIKPPYPGLAIDFVEYPNYLSIRIYENQILSLPEGHQVSVLEYLHKLRSTILSFGVDKVFFDGAKGDPPRGGLR
jgi:hypothetical protein